MARHAGPRLPLIVKNLIPTLSSVFDSQRVTATAFLAELLGSNVVNDLMLLEAVMDNMTGRQKDGCTLVRMLALRGLGNVADGSPEKVRASSASRPALRAPGGPWPSGDAACPRQALNLLLKDPVPTVRVKVAETLGRLVRIL
ncbi:hypothetical protein AV530_008740 [Patagioenas fasciata monilis]|uniref:Condensin complex subunit 1 C-terminal domain-containing protein n=1 Tax=Patagioenas fasciata monilis TaxID=372326 RepID=A0A1V4JZM5_PATFA|nr:hypothetical protein AV530_008740 [Patagioenas fasciata monilis]